MTGLDHGTVSGVFKNILESKTPSYVPSTKYITNHHTPLFSTHNRNHKIESLPTTNTFSPPVDKESD